MTAIAAGVVGEDAEEVDVYVVESLFKEVAAVKAYGATPDPAVVGPPPVVPPVIGEQFAASVDADGATLRAKINPRFWTDARYYVEYGTVDCEVGPCSSKPAPPGTALTSKVTSEAMLVKGIVIGGLAPSTTYHYRFLAKSGGGGPVFGTDRTFTTAAPQSQPATCPANAAFRSGPAPSSRLPRLRDGQPGRQKQLRHRHPLQRRRAAGGTEQGRRRGRQAHLLGRQGLRRRPELPLHHPVPDRARSARGGLDRQVDLAAAQRADPGLLRSRPQLAVQIVQRRPL